MMLFRNNIYFRSKAGRRRFCLHIILGSVFIFAGSFLLGNVFNTGLGDVSSPSLFLLDKGTRLLRFSQELLDPKSTAPLKNTVTIYLTRESYINTPDSESRGDSIFNPALSIFKTDILHRYGTGRVQYIIREHTECSPDCEIDGAVLQQEPCLAVTRHSKENPCDLDNLKCNYPQCKTMITNDEICDKVDQAFDARQYFTSDRPDSGYLPLGPRLDSWQALLEIVRLKNPQFFIMPASKRRFAFNAVFSPGRNSARQELALAIKQKGSTSTLPVFTSMTEPLMEANRPKGNGNHTELVTDEYMEVVLDSIFTLSPTGRNLESHRIFEAVEAGSIPVLSRDDLYDAHHPSNHKQFKDVAHPCKHALVAWYGAPIVVLDSWSDLYPTIEGLMDNPRALDEMQDKLGVWYEDYMHRVVSKFEDFMLDSTPSVASKSYENSPPISFVDRNFLS